MKSLEFVVISTNATNRFVFCWDSNRRQSVVFAAYNCSKIAQMTSHVIQWQIQGDTATGVIHIHGLLAEDTEQSINAIYSTLYRRVMCRCASLALGNAGIAPLEHIEKHCIIFHKCRPTNENPTANYWLMSHELSSCTDTKQCTQKMTPVKMATMVNCYCSKMKTNKQLDVTALGIISIITTDHRACVQSFDWLLAACGLLLILPRTKLYHEIRVELILTTICSVFVELERMQSGR